MDAYELSLNVCGVSSSGLLTDKMWIRAIPASSVVSTAKAACAAHPTAAYPTVGLYRQLRKRMHACMHASMHACMHRES